MRLEASQEYPAEKNIKGNADQSQNPIARRHQHCFVKRVISASMKTVTFSKHFVE